MAGNYSKNIQWPKSNFFENTVDLLAIRNRELLILKAMCDNWIENSILSSLRIGVHVVTTFSCFVFEVMVHSR